MRLKIDAAVLTKTGCVRKNNEDNFYLCGKYRADVNCGEAEYACTVPGDIFLAAVADGMGGEDAGELASLMAVKSLSGCAFDKVDTTARECVRRANAEICAEMDKRSIHMGSTLAALYIDKGRAKSCNIGDSRVYMFRDGRLKQLSTDHNMSSRMVELGILTARQAAHHPTRHELTQCLGIPEEEMIIEPALSGSVALKDKDMFLLCSDGLTDMLTNEEIAAVLTAGSTAQLAADKLVDKAIKHGGVDNITALVVHVHDARPAFLRRIFR